MDYNKNSLSQNDKVLCGDSRHKHRIVRLLLIRHLVRFLLKIHQKSLVAAQRIDGLFQRNTDLAWCRHVFEERDRKMAKNDSKYPIEKSKGVHKKYDEL